MSETRTNRRFSALVLSVDQIQRNSPAFQEQKTRVEHFNAVFQAMSKRVAPRASVYHACLAEVAVQVLKLLHAASARPYKHRTPLSSELVRSAKQWSSPRGTGAIALSAFSWAAENR
ncbi:hypothetical protein QQF64_022039 [Cirrhinus molitorella]|uniref:Uncharacterized protein n=1 Tax=Cirrhinus molitorella TaxID=172907 RepID=A0ABR3L716_9TELE